MNTETANTAGAADYVDALKLQQTVWGRLEWWDTPHTRCTLIMAVTPVDWQMNEVKQVGEIFQTSSLKGKA